MIKCIKHGKIRIICLITLDQYHPSYFYYIRGRLQLTEDSTYLGCIILMLLNPIKHNKETYLFSLI
jgi:hypothetical protein